jgi:hypothetical protein
LSHFQEKTFSGQRVAIDGNTYRDCRFTNGCVLKYGAMTPFFLENGTIDSTCTLQLDGPADVTLKFLAALYQAGFQDKVEALFENIRRNSFSDRALGT